jgi:hypothetical protein
MWYALTHDDADALHDRLRARIYAQRARARAITIARRETLNIIHMRRAMMMMKMPKT